MKLKNTKQYCRDLAHYYMMKGKMQLFMFFRGLVDNPSFSYSTEDTDNWFEYPFNTATRPERDEDGNYVDSW